jgi:glycosyltransferase involved in cell wall biosynthesis
VQRPGELTISGPDPDVARATPSVAVVVPAHRSSPALLRCLEAIRALEPAPDEVVVVVDGGDEAAAAQAAGAGVHVVLQQPAAGPAVARNTGAARTTSDIILFLDSDVQAPRDVIARVAQGFAQQPGVAALIGSYDDQPPAHNLASLYLNLRHHYVHQRAREEGGTFWGACRAIRREAFEQIGGFDEDYVAPSIETSSWATG